MIYTKVMLEYIAIAVLTVLILIGTWLGLKKQRQLMKNVDNEGGKIK